MAFVDDLYKHETVAPKQAWMRKVYEMTQVIKTTVASEHHKGKHHYHGYFYELEGDSYLATPETRLTFGVLSSCGMLGVYPLEEMCQALNDEVRELGFAEYRVHCDDVVLYKQKSGFVGSRLAKDRVCKTIWVDLSW